MVTIDDRYKLAFTTAEGTFVYNRLPMGLLDAPTFFCYVMHTILGDLVGKGVLIYIDDVILYSETFDEHLRLLALVLHRFRDWGMTVAAIKCDFFRRYIQFLGHIVDEHGQRVDPEKVSAIQDFPAPLNRTQLRSILGAVNFYHRFLQDMANVAATLFDLLSIKVSYKWNEEHQAAFEAVKKALTTTPVLAAPDFTLPFRLYVDASGRGMGATLMQADPDDPTKEHVIEYASTRMAPAEMKYAPTMLEARAVVWAVKKFRSYLLGHSCYVFTDHQALIPLFAKKNIEQAQLARWLAVLIEYDLTFVYRPGATQDHVDCLSRIFSEEVESPSSPSASRDVSQVLSIRAIRRDELNEVNPCIACVNLAMPAGALSEPDDSDWSDREQALLDEIVEADDNAPTALSVSLRMSQMQDPLVRGIIRYLKKGKLPEKDLTLKSQIAHLAPKCFIEADGMLMFKPRRSRASPTIFVPTLLRGVLIRAHHGDGLTQHFGADRTKERIARRYWWPDITSCPAFSGREPSP